MIYQFSILGLGDYQLSHSGKKVERIRRIPFHVVAALSAFLIEQGNLLRDGNIQSVSKETHI